MYSLSFGKEGLLTSHLAWHVRLGYHLSKFQELYSALLELSHREGKLSLKGGVKYQWNTRASNLWAQAEGNFALSDKIALVLGYRRRMMGEPFGLSDEMDFEGLYAGISVKL
ncbi:MAG: hypothetical protein H5U36_01110 [Candidatus Caldatribacterium sp.]|nr:hypothetical protein [Candidatus Caldatribacterium sp.]